MWEWYAPGTLAGSSGFSRRHQRHRHGEAGLAAEGEDPAAGLDGGADLAGAIAEEGAARLQVRGDEGEAPEEGGAVAAGALGRLRRLLDDLEDGRAEPEEGLAGSASRGRLLADAA